MTVITGIDLGTCFSVVAQFSESGEPLIVHNSDGSNLTPSVVWFDSAEARAWVGEIARSEWNREDAAYGEARTTAARFKRDMGTDKTFALDGQRYSARDLSTMILKKLVQDTTAALGCMGNAVVTIPANFGHPARVDTMSAAECAGLTLASDASLPNEPTAAALYYVFRSKGQMNGRYAIYDLGGGTFDISILEVADYAIRILATRGVRHLGGDDFDRCMQAIVLAKLTNTANKSPTKLDFTLEDAEKAKIILSKRREFRRELLGVEVVVTRDEFEGAIAGFVNQAEMLCETAIEEAGLTSGQIDGVLLVGGSTRIPRVRASVQQVFEREPDTSINPDEAVALGAAIYSALKADKASMTALQRRAVGGIALKEICGHFFGTIVLSAPPNGHAVEEENCTLILRDETVPCSVSRSYFTVSEGQSSVLCRLTECDHAGETNPQFVQVVREGHLELPAGRPAGQEIEVTYSIDENMKLKCEYKDVASGNTHTFDVDVTPATQRSGKAPSSIDKFLVE